MLFLTIAQVVKVVPSKNAAVVAIIKGNTNGVVAYGFYGFNADVLFTGLQTRSCSVALTSADGE